MRKDRKGEERTFPVSGYCSYRRSQAKCQLVQISYFIGIKLLFAL